jgi:hypothetical protein
MQKLPHTILADGEVTGHKHEVFGTGVGLYDDGREGILVLDVPEGADAEVRHEEHHTQPIAPGQYDRLIVREYFHFEEEARNVVD